MFHIWRDRIGQWRPRQVGQLNSTGTLNYMSRYRVISAQVTQTLITIVEESNWRVEAVPIYIYIYIQEYSPRNSFSNLKQHYSAVLGL